MYQIIAWLKTPVMTVRVTVGVGISYIVETVPLSLVHADPQVACDPEVTKS